MYASSTGINNLNTLVSIDGLKAGMKNLLPSINKQTRKPNKDDMDLPSRSLQLINQRLMKIRRRRTNIVDLGEIKGIRIFYSQYIIVC